MFVCVCVCSRHLTSRTYPRCVLTLSVCLRFTAVKHSITGSWFCSSSITSSCSSGVLTLWWHWVMWPWPERLPHTIGPSRNLKISQHSPSSARSAAPSGVFIRLIFTFKWYFIRNFMWYNVYFSHLQIKVWNFLIIKLSCHFLRTDFRFFSLRNENEL